MLVYLLSFVAFVFALTGLGVGLLTGRGGIRGTCGGLNNAGGCGICSHSGGRRECPRKRAA